MFGRQGHRPRVTTHEWGEDRLHSWLDRTAFLVLTASAGRVRLDSLTWVLTEALGVRAKALAEHLLGLMSRSGHRESNTTIRITWDWWSRRCRYDGGICCLGRYRAGVCRRAVAVEPEPIALAGAALGDAFGAAETT